MSHGLLCHCRAGFEAECAAELADRAARYGHPGHPRAERGDGYARFVLAEAASAPALATALDSDPLVFSRLTLRTFAELTGLSPEDRIGPMLDALHQYGEVFGDFVVEHPDSECGKPLAGLARSFGNALRPALRRARRLLDGSPWRLHVVFVSGTHAFLGQTRIGCGPAWPMGIPRLRLAREAPSRSALKLEEALLTLLSPREREHWLKPGMKAADLGAAPGGWSWVLARQGVQVTAIDNGPLADTAHATGLIRHVRADGFRWQPPQALDWMVCDMVEQPRRVAARMAEWFANGWCRRAIFNLKLPMKKRQAEVTANLADFSATCTDAGIPVEWRARQLYHDREEITVFATVSSGR